MQKVRPCFFWVMGLVALAACRLSQAGEAGPDSSRLSIDNGRLAIVVAGQEAKGAIVSLTDKATGRQWIAAGHAPRLFQLEFSPRDNPAGKRVFVTNREAAEISLSREASQGRTVGRVMLSKLAGRPIDIACMFTATEGDPLVRCRIAVRFPNTLTLEGIRFPLLALRTPSGPGATDALVFGATKGGIHRLPSGWKPARAVGYSQPGTLAAQFACYYDDAGGLMTAAEDSQGYPKSIYAVRTDDGLQVSWNRPCFETSRVNQAYDVVFTTFRSPDAGRPTDWRDGADIYKRWAVKQPWCAKTLAERDDLPDWLKQGPAMVRFGRDWLAQPDRIEGWLADYWKKHFPAGTPLVIAYWGWEKVDTWITPDYFPVFPSDEAFRRLVDAGRKVGGHTFLWPSGYHYTVTYRKQSDGKFAWDDRARFDAVARPHAVCARDGKVLLIRPFWLEGGQTATVCAGDPWTIDWLNRTAAGTAERGGELVQIDQVVGGGMQPCYSTQHGHPAGPGLWMTEAFHRQLDTMRETCRKTEPGAVVCFEEPNEWFNHQVGVQDYRDWEAMQQEGVEPASVFNYLYHEYLPTFQSNPQGGDLVQAAYCLASGQIPHLVPTMLVGAGPLLVNGAMEDWRGNVPIGWDKVSGYAGQSYSGLAFRDNQVRHAGRASLRLENHKPGEIVQVSQNVTVGREFAIGRKYRLSVWMKTAGLKDPNGIVLGTFTTSLANTGSWRIAMPQPAGDWVRGEATFTVPKRSQLLRIMLNVQGPGTVWIDDLALEEIRDDGSAVEVPRPDKPADHDFMRRWVELYHGPGRKYLALGKMLHPGLLETATIDVRARRLPAIFHNAFAAADGSQAVILVNATDAPQTGRLRWKEKTESVSLKPWEARLMEIK